jgi:hypothetical protein
MMEHDRKDIEDQNGIAEEESILENPVPKKKKKKRHPMRWFLLLILCVVAFLYAQQWYLDLEAEALTYARQTAGVFESVTAQSAMQKLLEATNTPTQPPPTATEEALLMYTQTVAAQLTNVAEFQQTPAAQ